MRVALIYRGRYHVREALDLETLASLLHAHGHQVTMIYDPDTFGVTDNVFQVPLLARMLNRDARTRARIVEAAPDVAIFSVLSSTYGWCRKMAESVRSETDARVVFLGLHPSLVPQHVMQHECVDFTIAGEAEGAVIELLGVLGGDGELSQVGNLWYRCGRDVQFTYRADLVDLDALPLPDKGLFTPYTSHRYSYCAIVSRGCPYQCSFCEETCLKGLYGKKYFRRKQVDTVMNELRAGKERFGFREVIFKDSYLSGNKGWLVELMNRYRAEIGVPFKCFCTISGFDEETARLLKQGGCYSIEFGLQTWNDRLRREVLNRRETNEDAFRAFALCDEQKLRYDVDHMFHLPTETYLDHEKGAECYCRLPYLGRVKVHFLVYYPTARILDHAIESGDLRADAADQLAEGQESDFYDQERVSSDSRAMASGYANLYKMLPLLPVRMVRWLARPRRARTLRFLPSLLIALLQGLNAIRCRDLRFIAYLRIYPVKVWHSSRASEPRQTLGPPP